MSGGHWVYKNDSLAMDIFGWHLSPDCGKGGFSKAPIARKSDPLEDKQLSEMLWDMLCILHSYDWYVCGDTCEKTYRDDVAYFKNKWLKTPSIEIVKREIDAALDEVREDLHAAFGIKAGDEE